MYRLIVLAGCLLVLVVNLMQVATAPVQSAFANQLRDSDKETVLSLVMNDPDAISETADLEERVNRRSKRHTSSGRHEEVAAIPLEIEGEDISPAERRQRRSAAWWISATISLCQRHAGYCKQVNVYDKDVSLNIRFEDE